MIRIAVCDDESTMLKFISENISLELKRLGVNSSISEFQDGNKLLKNHNENPFEIVFLDIQMPEISGFDIATALRTKADDIFIIFITSQEELVYDSFDFQPFNFIKKETPVPFLKRLNKILLKLLVHIKQSDILILEMPFSEKRAVRLKEIIFIKSNKNYLEYFLNNSQNINIRGKLADIEQKYREYNFIRVHNRYIVNMRHIKELDYPNDMMRLANGSVVEISRKYKSDFDKAYTLYLRSLR